MLKILVLLLSFIALPGLAVDCSMQECACLGIVYKEVGASPPGDLLVVVRSFDKLRSLTRFQGKYILAMARYSRQRNGDLACCNAVDNGNSGVSGWDTVVFSHAGNDVNGKNELHIAFHVDSPPDGLLEVAIDGSATTMESGERRTFDFHEQALSGESPLITMSKNAALITRAINNKEAELRSLIASGC